MVVKLRADLLEMGHLERRGSLVVVEGHIPAVVIGRDDVYIRVVIKIAGDHKAGALAGIVGQSEAHCSISEVQQDGDVMALGVAGDDIRQAVAVDVVDDE